METKLAQIGIIQKFDSILGEGPVFPSKRVEKGFALLLIKTECLNERHGCMLIPYKPSSWTKKMDWFCGKAGFVVRVNL